MTLKDQGIFLIGIGYRAQQGKDTFARFLQQQAPEDISIYSIGMDVIAPAARWLGLMEQEKAPAVMQDLAETWLKADPLHLIRILQWVILDDRPKVALITSIRDPLEVQWIKEHAGITLKVERFLPDKRQYVATDRPHNHPSEHRLDDYPFDYTISSVEGNLSQLYKDAVDLWPIIKQRF